MALTPEQEENVRKAALESRSPILALPLDAEQIRRFVGSDTGESFMAFQAGEEFSVQDIADACVNTARRFKTIKPYVASLDPMSMPGDTSIFLDGVASELYELQYRRLSRRDIDYTAGNMQANLVRNRLRHLERLIQDHRGRFERDASELKRHIGINSMYRHH